MAEKTVEYLENQEKDFILEECEEHGPCPDCGSVDLVYIIKMETIMRVNIEKKSVVHGQNEDGSVSTTIKCANIKCGKILNDIPNEIEHFIIN